ncbi:hypothetical protein L596_027912 [Steinernema carpocapsae]|uniref:Nicotinate phosphoribosyltransferase n=1 Tax=Steinernema carpocapsae TaxID=34508 RepID=A0A4U5LWX5_STECR|nr:hypothetical protein L596_027912 [Steinernema carpocapsae]
MKEGRTRIMQADYGRYYGFRRNSPRSPGLPSQNDTSQLLLPTKKTKPKPARPTRQFSFTARLGQLGRSLRKGKTQEALKRRSSSFSENVFSASAPVPTTSQLSFSPPLSKRRRTLSLADAHQNRGIRPMAFVLDAEDVSASNGLHMNGQDSLVQPLLTDFYQLTMCYGYWKAGMHNEPAVFDLFFRKNPFQGEFTIFAGLEDCLRFVQNFKFSKSDIDFLKKTLPTSTEPAFYEYLESLDCRSLRVQAVSEGSTVFPKVPLITVTGPLALCQLMETTFLNLVNYSSLVATNAARFRQVAGDRIELLEFGLRRAQGPNGGLSASKYCYIGGFDATSNLLAGKLYGIPVKGTQAHSFICSFSSEGDLVLRDLPPKNDPSQNVNLFALALMKLEFLMNRNIWGVSKGEVSTGELAAFCAYAIAFPESFLALIDTYDVLRSGVINFCAVTLALNDLGYRSLGCRIDSGDLSYLSKEVRARFKAVAEIDPASLGWFADLRIVASNDINEETIMSLNEQRHEIDAFGVGTHLVTCQKQPALGCVFKLVAMSGLPKIKLSQDVVKITIPGRKKFYRLFGRNGYAILDLMTLEDENEPKVGDQILCRHPFEESKRALVIPSRVQQLHETFWENGQITKQLPSLLDVKKHVHNSLEQMRQDHRRSLNPTPYKVSLSEKLYDFLHSLWLQNAPVGQLD